MARVILLTDQIIDNMIADAAFVEFSFVADPPRIKHALAPVRKSSCGGCRKKKKVVAPSQTSLAGTIAYNTFKQHILDLDAASLAALKVKLNCTGIKMQIREQRGAIRHRII